MIGISIAARLRVADLLIASRRLSLHVLRKFEQCPGQVRAPLIGRGEKRVRARTARFRGYGRLAGECFRSPHSGSMKPHRLGEFGDDLPLSPSYHLVDGVNDAAAGSHPHRQELVDGIDLDPHQLLTQSNGSVDLPPTSGYADEEPHPQERGSTGEGKPENKGQANAQGKSRGTCAQLANSIGEQRLLVVESDVLARLPQLQLDRSSLLAIDNSAQPPSQRVEQNLNQTRRTDSI